MKICIKNNLYIDLDCEKGEGEGNYFYVEEVNVEGNKVVMKNGKKYLKKVVEYGT